MKTKPWVARECGLDPRVAGRRIRVGKTLARHLPETERALAEGRISFDHAAVLAGACNDRNADDYDYGSNCSDDGDGFGEKQRC